MDEHDPSIGDIALPCGRRTCRKPVHQELGRGRRKEYCSDTCRRGADREYKQAKAFVERFEEQLRRSQHDVASYGRRPDESVLITEQVARLEAEARVAFARASTWVEAGVAPDRAVTELAALVQALEPILSGHIGLQARSA